MIEGDPARIALDRCIDSRPGSKMQSSPEILILSKASLEPTTEAVMDWLAALGARCLRLNGEDVDRDAAFSFELADGISELRLHDGSEVLPMDRVRVVWDRRWSHDRRFESIDLFRQGARTEHGTEYQVVRHLSQELGKTSDLLFSRFRGAFWLNDPETDKLNKLEVLEHASRVGLDVPATLLTTSKTELDRFVKRHGAVITKAIGDVHPLTFEDGQGLMYTDEVGAEVTAALSEMFFPSLFQEKIDKQYELRVFFLAGECYAMAIFSQQNQRTEVDFRQYDFGRPNRQVPYRLSAELSTKIVRLMEALGMDNGSLDLIKAVDGREVFLEVNPVGQFGMVSAPCNYHLERRVAEFLKRKATDGEA